MEKLQLLICDDAEVNLNEVKNLVLGNIELSKKFEILLSDSYRNYSTNYAPVIKRVEALKEKINIAIIDLDFRNTGDEEFPVERLGLEITRYLRNKLPGIKIILLSANFNDESKDFLGIDNEIKVLDKKNYQSDLIKYLKILIDDFANFSESDELPIKYYYEIELVGEKQIRLINKRIQHIKRKEPFYQDFDLTADEFTSLLAIALRSCINRDSKEINDLPGLVTTKVLTGIKNTIKQFYYNKSYKAEQWPVDTLNKMYKALNKISDSPKCRFVYENAEKLKFGKEDDCFDTCSIINVCLMNLPYTPINNPGGTNEIKEEDMRKYVKKLRDKLNSDNYTENFDNYFWLNDNSSLNKCSCNADKKERIKECKAPICSNLLIYTGKSKGSYSFTARPKQDFKNKLSELLEINKK